MSEPRLCRACSVGTARVYHDADHPHFAEAADVCRRDGCVPEFPETMTLSTPDGKYRALYVHNRAIFDLPDYCDACSAKPGAPTLCRLCLAVRSLKGKGTMR